MKEVDFCEIVIEISLYNHTISQYTKAGTSITSLFFEIMTDADVDMLLGHPEDENDVETRYALHGEILNSNFESDDILIYLEKVLTSLQNIIPEYNLKRIIARSNNYSL